MVQRDFGLGVSPISVRIDPVGRCRRTAPVNGDLHQAVSEKGMSVRVGFQCEGHQELHGHDARRQSDHKGLRFDAQSFPGSNFLQVTQLGGRMYRVRTAVYPHNLGYCENDGGISFWHVTMDVKVGPKS